MEVSPVTHLRKMKLEKLQRLNYAGAALSKALQSLCHHNNLVEKGASDKALAFVAREAYSYEY